MTDKSQIIKELIKQRQMPKALSLIKEWSEETENLEKDLKIYKIYKKFHDEIKRRIRNTGRSSIISVSEIDEELIKTGNELNKFEEGDNDI